MAIPLHNNIIVDKSFQLAILILKFAQQLQDNKQFILSNQLQRCGTSIGANIREAQNAESKADFIHKFKIAAKEAVIAITVLGTRQCFPATFYSAIDHVNHRAKSGQP